MAPNAAFQRIQFVEKLRMAEDNWGMRKTLLSCKHLGRATLPLFSRRLKSFYLRSSSAGITEPRPLRRHSEAD
jgi:hypothetical protein